MKKTIHAIVIGGFLIVLNVLALIVELIMIPETRVNFVSTFPGNLELYVILASVFAVIQVFIIGLDKWWKVLILPSLIGILHSIMLPEDGFELVYLLLTGWAKGLDVICNYFNLWEFSTLFCTVILWLYLVIVVSLARMGIRRCLTI